MPDLIAVNHGSIIRITPTSQTGRDWITENVHAESWQWLGRSLCVDPRCAVNLLEGASNDGLEVMMA